MKKYLLLFAFAIPTLLTSCLKDKNLTDKVYGTLGAGDIKVVEIKGAPEANVIFNVSTTPLNATLLTVNAGTEVKEDLSVTLVKDDALVTAAGYLVLAASEYSVSSLTVVIPKGKSSATIPIKLNNSASLLGTNFALGYKISSISNSSYSPSENYKTIVCPIIIQNEYAGEYEVTGARYNYTGAVAYPYPGPIPAGFTQIAHPPTKEMYTINATTSEIGVAGLAGLDYYYIITVPAGSTGVVNCLTTTTYSSTFLTDNSGIELKQCTYNTDTKTFDIVIRYINSGGNTRIMVEKFVKKP
jgi:hypothetical protein